MSEKNDPPAGEFTGWAEAQNYTDSEMYTFGEMAEAFNAGWEYAGFAADAKGEPAKVIVVVEAPVGDRAPAPLSLLRRGDEIAVYQPGAWLSVREDGALVPDTTARKLRIALAALAELSHGHPDSPGVPAAMGAIAANALDEIAELDL